MWFGRSGKQIYFFQNSIDISIVFQYDYSISMIEARKT